MGQDRLSVQYRKPKMSIWAQRIHGNGLVPKRCFTFWVKSPAASYISAQFPYSGNSVPCLSTWTKDSFMWVWKLYNGTVYLYVYSSWLVVVAEGYPYMNWKIFFSGQISQVSQKRERAGERWSGNNHASNPWILKESRMELYIEPKGSTWLRRWPTVYRIFRQAKYCPPNSLSINSNTIGFN